MPTTETRPAPPARNPWWKEPLLHFVVVGALLFALDTALVGRSTDPNTIVVDADVVAEAKNLYRATHQRDPSAAELETLTRRWVDNEILFREGIKLGVDQGDKMIRDRVIFKSLMVMETGLKLPEVDDGQLRAWFEKNRSKYDEPVRLDFQEAVLGDDKGDSAVRAFVAELNTGVPGDVAAGLRVFKGRPMDNVVQSYGAAFATALQALPVGQWQALPVQDGLRVIQLQAVTPSKPAEFDLIRNVVLQDWTDATMAELRTQAVRERGKNYRLEYAETPAVAAPAAASQASKP